MTDPDSIDNLVSGYISKSDELSELGERISRAGRETVVMFVDLVGSTALKGRVRPNEWLGYIFRFIEQLSSFAHNSGGTVVKRIGDEVMITFPDVKSSERFLDRLLKDAKFNERYEQKIAVDYGTAFHFQFDPKLQNDPYGLIVDRCARMARLAGKGVLLAGEAFVNKSEARNEYHSIGQFSFKGIADPLEVFVRSIQPGIDTRTLLQPLVAVLNDKHFDRPSFRSVPRVFTPVFVSGIPKGRARPFLLSHLLNLPHLPDSLPDFLDRIDDQDEERRREYVGYLINWDARFDSWSSLDADDLLIFVVSEEPRPRLVKALVPSVMRDVMKSLKKGIPLSVRGVIQSVDGLQPTLNFVELSVRNPASGSG